MRCWRARKEADYLRKRVCSAVLIQSAWKTYVARKKLILLKQAAIILQAHYKGRLARKKFAIDLENFRKERERKRKEEEALRKKRERERLEAQRRESEPHSWTFPQPYIHHVYTQCSVYMYEGRFCCIVFHFACALSIDLLVFHMYRKGKKRA